MGFNPVDLAFGNMDALRSSNERLRDENAKLREELAKARDPQRIGGQADPSSFVYAIEQLREFRWQHATNDEDAIPYINNVAAAHERENAKLRELVGTLRGYLAGDTGPCDCCAMQGTCENHPAPPPCKYELDGEHAPVLGWIDDNLNELGVDV